MLFDNSNMLKRKRVDGVYVNDTTLKENDGDININAKNQEVN